MIPKVHLLVISPLGNPVYCFTACFVAKFFLKSPTTLQLKVFTSHFTLREYGRETVLLVLHFKIILACPSLIVSFFPCSSHFHYYCFLPSYFHVGPPLSSSTVCKNSCRSPPFQYTPKKKTNVSDAGLLPTHYSHC